MLNRTLFQQDLEANPEITIKNRRFWVLLFLRMSQSVNGVIRFLGNVGKKVILLGTGCSLPSQCFEGGGLRIPHPNGIINNENARLGRNVTIYQQVTIGVKNDKEKGAARIGDEVLIGAGAKIIGEITIGNKVKIGANSTVIHDIPDNAIVYNKSQYLIKESF